MVLNESLMSMRQTWNSVIFSERPKREGSGSRLLDLEFRERRCAFSLDLWSIGPSVFDGARSKVALRGEGYVWAPIWWSSENSKRLGSFPTCVNICLRAM